MKSKYQAGQVWTYNHRDDEDESRLVILRVEMDEKAGAIVHAFIDGVSIRNPRVPAGINHHIGHMPFSQEAIDRSVNEQVGMRDLPDFEEGYRTWRNAFDDGKAGIFTITVGEAVGFMETALNKGS